MDVSNNDNWAFGQTSPDARNPAGPAQNPSLSAFQPTGQDFRYANDREGNISYSLSDEEEGTRSATTSKGKGAEIPRPASRDESNPGIIGHPPGSDEPAPKRGRGRPPGAKNKPKDTTRMQEAPSEEPSSLSVKPSEGKVKRPVGRPRGTGYKQIAQSQLVATAGPVTITAKRPVGRPRKHLDVNPVPKGIATQIQFGKFIVAGVGRQMSTSSSSVGGSNLSNDFVDPPPPVEPTQIPESSTTPTPAETLPESSLPSSSASQVQNPQIIPEENVQAIVDPPTVSDDDDRYSGLMDDGVGDDNDGEDDEEGIDQNPQDPGDGGTRKKKRRPMPDWLLAQFKEKLEECRDRDSRGLPPLYRNHHTFWFPRPSTFFMLQKANVCPQDLFAPEFSLWDPEPLCDDGIPCPNCSTKLIRHDHIPLPRRFISWEGSVYMIGFRYRCQECNLREGVNATFRSWDSRILAVLPPALAAEFPARLCHRSGISTSVFKFMRSCFQNGMGAKQFSDALRIQHLQRYDDLNLQYMRTLAARCSLAEWNGQKFEPFPPFNDQTSKGINAFVPSSQWLRDMYDKFIEEHEHELNQHTSMLSAEICAIDHSHKITKHIARVNGVKVFTALLTVTNENGEIRICALVATKSHSQFEKALQEMLLSLKLYGHSMPKIFYTDNMADKQFLEKVFASLREGVVPVEKFAQLEPMVLPKTVVVTVKKTSAAIDDAIRTILDCLAEDGTGITAVGFDSEWNIETSEDGRIIGRGHTAIVQIAHGNCVFILQLGAMLASRQLPQQLKLLLSNPNVLKVGRMVSADLKYLQTASGSSVPFVGAVDLAKFAKDRLYVSNAKCSLADLAATVLRKRLSKSSHIRLSSAWEDEKLSPEMLNYAALDAYSSLLIYETLRKVDPPQPLPKTITPSMQVVVYGDDFSRVIARGQISPHFSNAAFDSIQITSKRTVVEIESVFVPGAIISTHQKRALEAFGSPPFSIVCLKSHLRICNPTIPVTPLPESLPVPAVGREDIGAGQDTSGSIIESGQAGDEPDISNEVPSLSESIGSLVFDHVDEPESEISLTETAKADRSETDHSSALEGDAILGPTPNEWSVIRSRVLNDAFHIFGRFYISVGHGLRVEFCRALRDAMFIPDDEDRRRISAWGATQKPLLTFEDIVRTRPAWTWKHCKRVIPPAEHLYPLVEKVFRAYGPLKDAKTGAPLFNKAAWKTAKNILSLIHQGFVSDPPGIPLYSQIGVDATHGGLPIYRCARGTTFTEGGVHSHLRPRLPTSGASVRHVNASLLDFVIRHNLLVGTFNTTGKHYQSHFSIWVTNELQELYEFLHDILEGAPKLTGWVNGNLYIQTKEVPTGIQPIPEDVRKSHGMAAYVPSVDKKQPRHSFLASKQCTRKPALPIHTSYERERFRKLMRENEAFGTKADAPNWKEAAKVWNRLADDDVNLSYKLVEQLTAYHTSWETASNVKETLSATLESRKPILKAVRDPTRSANAPPIPKRPLKAHDVQEGLTRWPDPQPIDILNAANIRTTQPAASTSAAAITSATPSTSVTPSISAAPPTNVVATSSAQPTIRENARKRVGENLSRAEPPKKAKRSGRTCQKCRLDGCPGRKGSSYCHGVCADCGKASCRGRNSKKPKVKCFAAWD